MYRLFVITILIFIIMAPRMAAQELPPMSATAGVFSPEATPTLSIFTPTPTLTPTATPTVGLTVTLRPLPSATPVPEKDCRTSIGGCVIYLPIANNRPQSSGEVRR